MRFHGEAAPRRVACRTQRVALEPTPQPQPVPPLPPRSPPARVPRTCRQQPQVVSRPSFCGPQHDDVPLTPDDLATQSASLGSGVDNVVPPIRPPRDVSHVSAAPSRLQNSAPQTNAATTPTGATASAALAGARAANTPSAASRPRCVRDKSRRGRTSASRNIAPRRYSRRHLAATQPSARGVRVTWVRRRRRLRIRPPRGISHGAVPSRLQNSASRTNAAPAPTGATASAALASARAANMPSVATPSRCDAGQVASRPDFCGPQHSDAP